MASSRSNAPDSEQDKSARSARQPIPMPMPSARGSNAPPLASSRSQHQQPGDEKSPDKLAAQGSTAAAARTKPTFKHNLGKITEATHFAGAIASCGAAVTDNDKAEEDVVAQSILQALVAVEMNDPHFPCRPSSRVSRPNTEEGGAGPNAPRPVSMENARASRIFLGHKVNEMAQTGLAACGLAKGDDGWKLWQEARAVAAQQLYPIAHNSFKIALGIDRNASPTPAVPFSYLPVGPKEIMSLADINNAVLVHHWGSGVAANAFHRAWYALQSAIVEFGLEGLAVPFTTIFCFSGSYVSATALPPVSSSSVTNPVMAPKNSLLRLSLNTLATVLDVDAASLKPCLGCDGRIYLTNVTAYARKWCVPTYPRLPLRYETMRRFLVAPEKAAGMSLASYVESVAVPDAVAQCRATVQSRSEENQALAAVLRDNIVPVAMHSAGLNMRLLCSFALHVLAQDETPATSAVNRVLIDAAVTEMVGRAVKDMLLFEMEQREKKGFVGERDRLEVINRIVRLLIGRDLPFWSQHVVPAVRLKYLVPADAEAKLPFDITKVHVASLLKIISTRTASVLVPDTGRFDRFVAFNEVKVSIVDVPHFRKHGLGAAAFQAVSDAARRCQKGEQLKRDALVGHAALVALYGGMPAEASTAGVVSLFEEVAADISALQRTRLFGLLVQLPSSPWVGECQKALAAGMECLCEGDARIAVDRNIALLKLLHDATPEEPLGPASLKGLQLAFGAACKLNAFQWNCAPSLVNQLMDWSGQLGRLAPEERGTLLALCTTIETCIGQQTSAGQLQAELCQHICKACLDVTGLEASVPLIAFTNTALQHVRKNKGTRHSCSVILTYFLAYFSLHNIAERRPDAETSVRPAIGAVWKIIEKTLTLSTKQQVATAGAFVPNSVLYKIAMILRRYGPGSAAATPGDAMPDVLLLAHVRVFCPHILYAYGIQRVGRGYLARRKMSHAGSSGGAAVDAGAGGGVKLKREATSVQMAALAQQASQVMNDARLADQKRRKKGGEADSGSDISDSEGDDEPGIQTVDVTTTLSQVLDPLESGTSFVVVSDDAVPTEAELSAERFLLLEHDERRNVFKLEVKDRFELIGARDAHRRVVLASTSSRTALFGLEETSRAAIEAEYAAFIGTMLALQSLRDDLKRLEQAEHTARHGIEQAHNEGFRAAAADMAADYHAALKRAAAREPATPLFVTGPDSAPITPMEDDGHLVERHMGRISPRVDIDFTLKRLELQPPSAADTDELACVMQVYRDQCGVCAAAGSLQKEHDDQSAAIGHLNSEAHREAKTRLRHTLEEAAAAVVVATVLRALPPIQLHQDDDTETIVADSVATSAVSRASYINTRLGVFVHVWRNRAAAQQFQEVFEAAAASLTIVPRTVFASPCSVLLAFQCAAVTVTWLVPAVLRPASAPSAVAEAAVSVEVHADRMFQQLFGMSARCCFPSKDTTLVYVVPTDLKRVTDAGLRHEHFLCDHLGFGASNPADRDTLAVSRACVTIRKHLTYVGSLTHSSFVRILQAANVAQCSFYTLLTCEGVKTGTENLDNEVARFMLNAMVAMAFRVLVDQMGVELAVDPSSTANTTPANGRKTLLLWASRLYAALLSSTTLLRKTLVPVMIDRFGFPADFSVAPHNLSLKLVMAAIEQELAIETKNIAGPMGWVRPTVQSFSHGPLEPADGDAQESVKRILHSADVAVRQGLLLRALHFAFNPSPVLTSEAERWLEGSPVAAVSYVALRNCIAPTPQSLEREIACLATLDRDIAGNVHFTSVRLCDLWAILRTWRTTGPLWLQWIHVAVDFYASATATTATLQRVATELVNASNFLAASEDPLNVLVLARNNVAATINAALTRHSPHLVGSFLAGTFAHTFLQSLAADDPEVRCQALLPLAVQLPYLIARAPVAVTASTNIILTACIGALFVVLKSTGSLVAPVDLTVLALQLNDVCASKRRQSAAAAPQWTLEEATLLSSLAALALGASPYVLTCSHLLAHIDTRVPLLKHVAESVRRHCDVSAATATPLWDVETLDANAVAFAAQTERTWRAGLRAMELELYSNIEAQASAEQTDREIREKERIARHRKQIAALVEEETRARDEDVQQESTSRVILSQNERTELSWSDGASTVRRLNDLGKLETGLRSSMRKEMLGLHTGLVLFAIGFSKLLLKHAGICEDVDDQEFTERDELKDYCKLDRAEASAKCDTRHRVALDAAESLARREILEEEDFAWVPRREFMLGQLQQLRAASPPAKEPSPAGAAESPEAAAPDVPTADDWLVPVDIEGEGEPDDRDPSNDVIGRQREARALADSEAATRGTPAETMLPGAWSHVPTPRNNSTFQSEFDRPPEAQVEFSDDEDSTPADSRPSSLQPSRIGSASRAKPTRIGSAGLHPAARRDGPPVPSGRAPRVSSSQQERRPVGREMGTQTATPRSSPRAPEAAPLEQQPPQEPQEALTARVAPAPAPAGVGSRPSSIADSEGYIRPLSRKLSERLMAQVSDALLCQPEALSPQLDILYRSAQQCRSFGPALALLLFMDVVSAPSSRMAQRRANAASPPAASPSAAAIASEQPSPTKVYKSQEIHAMRNKMRQLELASLTVQLHQTSTVQEGKRRRRLELDFDASLAQLGEQEDAARIVIQLHVDQRALAAEEEAATHGARDAGWRPSTADRELAQLRDRSRRLMAGQRVNQRGAASDLLPPLKVMARTFIKPVNPVSAMLKQLQAELMEMDPTSRRTQKSPLLAPLPPRGTAAGGPASASAAAAGSGAGSAKVLHRTGSAQAVRPTPTTFELPFTQAKVLTAEKLPPIVATVLGDRNFSTVDDQLPPASSNVPLHTALGQMLPCAARTAVDIAVQKQQLAMEVERATYSDISPAAIATVLAANRPSSAALRAHSAAALPAAIAKVNRTIDATCEVQIFARCFLARRQRMQQAGLVIARWTFKKVYNSVNRKRTFQDFKRARQCDSAVLARYFQKYVLWRVGRLDTKALCRSLVKRAIIERRVFGTVGAKAFLDRSINVILVRRFYYWWQRMAQRKVLGRRIQHLCVVNANRHARSRLQGWADTFTDGQIHFGPEIRRTLAALRLERKNKNVVREKVFATWINVFVKRLQQREGRCQLYQAYHAVRRQHIAREVDRVWCIAMIQSGWARKYFKQAYHQWREWLLLRKPHLVKKRKSLYSL